MKGAFLIIALNDQLNLGMWYSSREETNGRKVRPSMDTSTYLNWDVGYGILSQTNKAQDVQRTFITPGHHRHISTTKIKVYKLCVSLLVLALWHFTSKKWSKSAKTGSFLRPSSFHISKPQNALFYLSVKNQFQINLTSNKEVINSTNDLQHAI